MITVKKTDYIYLLVLVFMIVTLSIIGNLNKHILVNSPITNPERIVIIDAGHGGEDDGATSITGRAEKDINLEISLILADMLKVSGYQVIMTRTEDISLAEISLATVRERKQSDMNRRLDIINKNPQALYISIHQNFYQESYCYGSQVFYNENNIGGKALAEHIQGYMVNFADPTNDRVVKSSGNEYFLLSSTYNPGVIVECGFISNPVEANKLLDSEYQQVIAYSIMSGIEAYYQNIII